MKPAICHKCGKDLKRTVPDDATDVTCFACDNTSVTERERDRLQRELRFRKEWKK